MKAKQSAFKLLLCLLWKSFLLKLVTGEKDSGIPSAIVSDESYLFLIMMMEWLIFAESFNCLLNCFKL